MIELKKLKKGEVFKRKETARGEFIKDYYDRSSKKYVCTDVNDINRWVLISGDKKVFI